MSHSDAINTLRETETERGRDKDRQTVAKSEIKAEMCFALKMQALRLKLTHWIYHVRRVCPDLQENTVRPSQLHACL